MTWNIGKKYMEKHQNYPLNFKLHNIYNLTGKN